MKTTKGQSALEFLTTYGWAFMIILVMIGSLSYFGVLNMNTFIPERCQFDNAFSCTDFTYEMGSPPKARMAIVNTLGKSIKFVNTSATCSGTAGSCETCQAPNWCDLNTTTAGEDATYWLPGETRYMALGVTGGSSQDLLKVSMEINYIPANQYFIQTSRGSIFIKG
ncbi:MAG: hypothetical protein ABIJ21_03080 [Nanoarchaeota archaeon]